MKKIIAYFILMVFILVHSAVPAPAVQNYNTDGQSDDVFSAQASPLPNTGSTQTLTNSEANDEIFHGHAEVNDKLEEKNKELFTGEIDQLVPKDVIKMTVSQVLSTGYTEAGDEFFAEITSDVEGDKGIILPAGTIAHGTVKEIQESKRL